MTDKPDNLLAQLQALSPVERARLLALVQQSGGVNLGTGTTIGQTGDIIGGDQHQGTVNVSDDARIDGVAVGVNLGTIIYGRDPQEDERRRLVWYLARLSAKLYHLPLRGLEQRLDQGQGMALPQVYVMLATDSEGVFVADSLSADVDVAAFFEDAEQTLLKPEYQRDWALPTHAIIDTTPRTENAVTELYRAKLVTEAVHQHPRLVLLGTPGSGKSTFVHHLAWALAQRGLDQAGEQTALFGWNDQRRLMPVILPLRSLSGRLARSGVSEKIVYAALCDEMQDYCLQQIDDLLHESLHRGKALLLLDGLDEVPLDAVPGGTVDRVTTLRAVRDFTQLYPKAQAVVTCRTRAFDETLRQLLGWPVEMIAPFTLGQVRHFVPAWYRELAATGQVTAERADRLARHLIDAIVASPKLRDMAGTPLLLTMMALVLYNKGELPRDRPLLYERILELLLGQWDKVRAGQNLAEALDLPDWSSERIQPLLDRLSYEAHRDSTSVDGGGQLARGALYTALIDFFRTARVARPGDVALRCLDYIEQRSGLLTADGPETYVFAHLTLQEHCAGRHIALGSDDPVALVLRHRPDEHWREPILLGMGLAHPAVLNSVLSDLIDREESGQPKPIERWYRDLLLAAEIGEDRDWNYLRTRPMVKVDRLQRDLKHGLVELLADRNQPLPVAERVRAGFYLGELGDPRFPVMLDEWRREITRARDSDPNGYFCRVAAGTYIIGSAEDDPDARADEKPQHKVTFDAPFWIARYPITNVQWQAWVQASGERSYLADDTDLNRPNQPVVAVTWHMCNDFCAWLSEQIGATVRLPSEYEWEAAARGHDARRYPWGDAWQADHAATMEDQEIRDRRWTVPVGCYPSGAAPCGALDMAGNVWEWTTDRYYSYPGAEKPFTYDNYRMIRGGSYGYNSTFARCGARGWVYSYYDNDVGFRVVLAP